MNQEQGTIGYDAFFLKPVEERFEIFNEISAENRAFLVKTHAERWLAGSRFRLTHEQVSVVEEFIQAISPEWYKTRHDFFEEINQEAKILVNKVKADLPSENILPFLTNRAEYIPVIENENN